MTADPFDRAVERIESDREARRKQRHQRRRQLVGRSHRTAFRIHATVFAGVNALLVLVCLLQAVAGGTWHPWFIYPLLGWGIGLGAHYIAVHHTWRRGGGSRRNNADSSPS